MNTSVYECYCHYEPKCVLENCFSTVGCFYSAKLNSNKTRIVLERYGCLPNQTNYLLSCPPEAINDVKTSCCKNSNEKYCNRQIGLAFRNDYFASIRDILFASLVPFALFLIILIVIVFYWHNRIKWHAVIEEKYKLKSFIKKIPPNKNNVLSMANSNFPILEEAKTETFYMQKVNNANIQHSSPNDILQDDITSKCDSFTTGSGSGSGMPFLVPCTIARQIELVSCIGKGRYGEVWKGICQSELVAVKIFSSRDEASWARETEIYNSGLLRHANILAYYASDMLSRGGCTQLWLITAYHELGSLHDFLCSHEISFLSTLKILRSCSSGLAFMHMEISGVHAKPAIAHRDIKTKNILLKNDGEVCIGDLGLALVNSSLPSQSYNVFSIITPDTIHESVNFTKSSVAPPLTGPRVGTKRYMAPELLLCQKLCQLRKDSLNMQFDFDEIYSENSESQSTDQFECEEILTLLCGYSQFGLNKMPFELFQKSDIYSFALVIWETLRRSKTLHQPSKPDSYLLPYADLVPADPTVNQMRRVIVYGLPAISSNPLEKVSITPDECKPIRPTLSERWLNDCYARKLVKIMIECWTHNCNDRLSALCCKKALFALENEVIKFSQNVSTNEFNSCTEIGNTDVFWPNGLKDMIGLNKNC